MMTGYKLSLFAQTSLLPATLCKMYRVYCLNYILNESVVKLKNLNFANRMLHRSRLFNGWMEIIKHFQIQCQLSKFTIRCMPFKTQFTSLNNKWQWFTKIITITAVTVGSIADLKLFWPVYIRVYVAVQVKYIWLWSIFRSGTYHACKWSMGLLPDMQNCGSRLRR